MNKRVLNAAQLRAYFKNYSLGLALAGVALTAGKCEDKKDKDDKSKQTPEELKKKLATAEDEKKTAETNLTTVFEKIETATGSTEKITLENFAAKLDGICGGDTKAMTNLLNEVKNLGNNLKGVDFSGVNTKDELIEKIQALAAKVVTPTSNELQTAANLMGISDKINTDADLYKAWAKKHGLDEKKVTDLDTFKAEYKAMLVKIAKKFAQNDSTNVDFVNTFKDPNELSLAALEKLAKATSTSEADVYKAVGNALKLKKGGAGNGTDSDITTLDDLKTELLTLVNRVIAVTGGTAETDKNKVNEFSAKMTALETALNNLKTIVTDEMDYQAAVPRTSAATVKKKGAENVSNLQGLEAAIKSIANALKDFTTDPNATGITSTNEKLDLAQVQAVIAKMQDERSGFIKGLQAECERLQILASFKANGTGSSNMNCTDLLVTKLQAQISAIMAANGADIKIAAVNDQLVAVTGNTGDRAFKPCTDVNVQPANAGGSGSILFDELTKKTVLFNFDALVVGTQFADGKSYIIAEGDITAKYENGKIVVTGNITTCA